MPIRPENTRPTRMPIVNFPRHEQGIAGRTKVVRSLHGNPKTRIREDRCLSRQGKFRNLRRSLVFPPNVRGVISVSGVRTPPRFAFEARANADLLRLQIGLEQSGRMARIRPIQIKIPGHFAGLDVVVTRASSVVEVVTVKYPGGADLLQIAEASRAVRTRLCPGKNRKKDGGKDRDDGDDDEEFDKGKGAFHAREFQRSSEVGLVKGQAKSHTVAAQRWILTSFIASIFAEYPAQRVVGSRGRNFASADREAVARS